MSPAVVPPAHLSMKRKRPQSTAGAADVEMLPQPGMATCDALANGATTLALDSLIEQRTLSDASRLAAEALLHAVNDSLSRLPRRPKPLAVDSAALRNTLRRVAPTYAPAALFRAPDFATLSVAVSPPEQINVVGSFLLGTSTALPGEPLIVDLAVQMPSTMFVDADILNFRYHDKRLVYLLYLARHFVRSEEGQWTDISILSHPVTGDPAKPTLTLSQPENAARVIVRIIPTFETGFFDESKLSDNRRNLRAAGESSLVTDISQATPAYNQSILLDATPVRNLATLHVASKTCPAFTAATQLLAAWASRHRLLPSSFALSALLADLISRKRVPARADRNHLVRAALHAMRAGALPRLRLHAVPVLVGATATRIARIANTARAALHVLESPVASRDPWAGVTAQVFGVPRGGPSAPLPLPVVYDGAICALDAAHRPLRGELEPRVRTALQRAFVDTGRVAGFEMTSPGVYGIFLHHGVDPARKVDVCPIDADADAFESFWGNRSSLRRFRDGRIARAVVWSGGPGTVQEIADFVVEHHFDGAVSLRVTLDDIETAARLVDTTASSTRAIAAFNELANTLRGLEELPLSIRSVHAAAPTLRRCALFPVRPCVGNLFIEPLDIIATFETSPAWPEDAVAVAAAKASFYVALRSQLASKGVLSDATISFLDIQLSGFIFRLRLRVDKEPGLLAGRPEEADALVWQTDSVIQHHDGIRTVRSPLLGRAARLAKAWLNSHMLFGVLGDRRDELVEILVAAVLNDDLITPPRSTLAAFCRFLHLVAEFPWEVCPLVVSLSNDTNDDDEDDFSRQIDRADALATAQKAHDAAPLPFDVFVARGAAVQRCFCGSHAVERVVVSRLRSTAAAALKHIAEVSRHASGMLRTAFVPDISGFDLCVKLDTWGVVGHPASADGPLAARCNGVALDRLAAGLDPAKQVMDSLRTRLGDWALFIGRFRDGDEVYVKWRPVHEKRVKFALREAAFREPMNKEEELVVSDDELVDEIVRVADGLVVQVEKLK